MRVTGPQREDKHTKDAFEILAQAWGRHWLQTTISLQRMRDEWVVPLLIKFRI